MFEASPSEPHLGFWVCVDQMFTQEREETVGMVKGKDPTREFTDTEIACKGPAQDCTIRAPRVICHHP